MDNLTHSLTGVALARAGLDRWCPRALWLLLLSANAPDGDIVFATRGAFSYFEHHRGYSHSLLAVPVWAAVVPLLVAAVSRQKLPWLRAWLVCVVGLASHLLLDWTNSYGVRLLLPFSSAWFHLDLNGLYDVWIWAVLLFALVWPLFSSLVTREIGERRKPAGRALATLALIFFLAFDLFRATLHSRVVAQLQSRLYNGAPPLKVAALPDSFTPLRWAAVVETGDAYRWFEIRPFGLFNVGPPQIFYKPAVTPALAAAESIQPFRYFLYFARFPVWSLEPVVDEHNRGTRIDLTDLRFGRPRAGSFHCIAYTDASGRALRQWFTFGSGADR